MKIDKARACYISAIYRTTSDADKVAYALEIFSELIAEAQERAKSQVQQIRLGDLWNLVDDARKATGGQS